MIQVNLIPDIKIQMIKARTERVKVISISIAASIISISIVIVLALYTYGAQALIDNNLNSKIDEETAKLNSVKDISKILTIQNQLSAITTINNQKNINSRIYDTIKSIKQSSGNTLSYTSISLDTTTQTFSIQGEVPGYSSYEELLKALQNSFVRYRDSKDGDFNKVPLASSLSSGQATFSKNSLGNTVLGFSLSFTYPKELFLPTKYDVSVIVEKYGNVTDSYLGVPTSLFVNTINQGGV